LRTNQKTTPYRSLDYDEIIFVELALHHVFDGDGVDFNPAFRPTSMPITSLTT